MRLLTASLFLLSFLPAAAQTTPVMTLHDLKDAESLGADLYANSGATGLVLVVVRGNQVYFQGYGEAVPGSHEAPSRDSVVRLCSLTKIFTSDLLAKLVSDGNSSSGRHARKNTPPKAQSFLRKVRRSPWRIWRPIPRAWSVRLELRRAGHRTFPIPDYETRWHWLASAQLKFTPGTQAFYSNVGFDLLSDALAKATQTPYAALLETRTLKPLRMWQTTFYPNPGQCERLMTGAHEEGPCTITASTEGSSGLYSTPADMEKFLSYLVGAGAPGPARQFRPTTRMLCICCRQAVKASTDWTMQADRAGSAWDGCTWARTRTSRTSLRRPEAERDSRPILRFIPRATRRCLWR